MAQALVKSRPDGIEPTALTKSNNTLEALKGFRMKQKKILQLFIELFQCL